MNCLKKELKKLTKETFKLDETLNALKKHPKILKIQELDVKHIDNMLNYSQFSDGNQGQYRRNQKITKFAGEFRKNSYWRDFGVIMKPVYYQIYKAKMCSLQKEKIMNS